MNYPFQSLAASLAGELFYDSSPAHQAQLRVYATDASVYQERPIAVAHPRDTNDIRKLVDFARANQLSIIPRAAGTSLAGQVVGNGIIADVSRYMNQVLEINVREKWVRVQPGVIRDDLNKILRPHGLLFGPETSTSSRAMIGGMLGNNSCGLHSIVWGSMRDHVLEVKAVLSDGSEAVFGAEPKEAAGATGFKGEIEVQLHALLRDKANQQLITSRFPKASITRRNTGYALDSLLQLQPYKPGAEPFNTCKLLAGSEGTLLFATEIKLNLIDLPPAETVLVCIHCATIDQALRANIIALAQRPMASELVDRFIMNFTRQHPEYRKNCFFIEGDPAALLLVEFMGNTQEEMTEKAGQLVRALQENNIGYAYPLLYNQDTRFAWEVRKAGLGLLRNEPGDTQPVNLIEDCAVSPEELPEYIHDLQQLLDRHKVKASYYAHAGAGELHVEPMINLKTKEGVVLFRQILADTVELVKKYNGALSGEHGDGRLRGEYIPALMGEEVYTLFKKVKSIFDPHGVFNKGKIVDTPPMDSSLRYVADQPVKPLTTSFDFSGQQSMLRLAEKCSGSGDCRKTEMTGGTMCPSFMATRREKDSTRARANILRQFLSDPEDTGPLEHREIYEVMDLCLSCKACKTECPSGVDVTKLKAEFLQQYYSRHGVPFRAKLVGNFASQMKTARRFRPFYNFIFGNKPLRSLANRITGFHPQRSIPLLPAQTVRSWFKRRTAVPATGARTVVFFNDEFTNYLDTAIGIKAILLLEALGYRVLLAHAAESGRTWLSKGLVKKAAAIANENIASLSAQVNADTAIVGIEPSAILTLRDEYPDLATAANKDKARALAKNTFTIEEFLVNAFNQGAFSRELFTTEKKQVVLHGHCYQKALSAQHYGADLLGIPPHYTVQVIPSGCCGMAGSFGYEKEHFEISQQIGELVLFPSVRSQAPEVLIAAAGTSCRHQIKDGTSRKALHPVEILYNALIVKPAD